MGVDVQALRFLLRSKSTVSFESFLMLGRQWRHVKSNVLKKECKKNSLPIDQPTMAQIEESRFVEPMLKFLGASKIDSLDFSDYEQATIVHDINAPIPDHLKNRFTCVYDGGTLEHVFDFPRAIRNAMEMVAVGGHFMGGGASQQPFRAWFLSIQP